MDEEKKHRVEILSGVILAGLLANSQVHHGPKSARELPKRAVATAIELIAAIDEAVVDNSK